MRTTLDVLLDFQSNTRALENTAGAVDRLKQRFDSVISTVAKLGAGVLSIGALASGVKRLSGEAFALAEKFDDLSKRMGVGFESVQVLDHIARDFGETADVFTGAFDHLQKKLSEARQGSVDAITPFHQLNVTIAELDGLTPERQLEVLARGMVNATDESKAFLAVSEILGVKATPQLLTALQQLGTEGFDKLSQSARDAGQIMSESTGKALADAKQQIEEFGRTVVNYWAEKIGSLARAGNELVQSDGLSPADVERKITADAIARMQAGANSVRSEPERAAMLERLRAEAERLEKLEQIEAYDDIDRRVPQSDSERARSEGIGQQARATRSAIEFLEREGSQQIERNTAADASEQAAKAANMKADAERTANAWLEKNREAIEAQARAYDESLMADADRLRVLQERLALIEQETAARMQASASEAEAERIRLEGIQARLPLLREAQQLEEKIARDKERAVEAAEREAEKAARDKERELKKQKPSPEALIELQRHLEVVNALRTGVNGVSHAFAEALVSGKDFGDSMKDILKQVVIQIIAATVKAFILRTVLGMFGGGAAGMLGLESSVPVPAGNGYADGGYTGPGPKNRIAGVVHGGEYVFSKREVDSAGLSFFRNVSQSIRHAPGYAAGGFVGRMPAVGNTRADAGVGVTVHNHFEAGVTPQYLAQLIPVIEERTKYAVYDGLSRREYADR